MFNKKYEKQVQQDSKGIFFEEHEPGVSFPFNNAKFSFLIDPQRKFSMSGSQYLVEPVQPLLLLNLVTLTPDQTEERMLIRKTWGNSQAYTSDLPTRTIFVLGLSDDDEKNKLAKYESYLYNDILQVDFKDSPLNLTYKTFFGMKWAATYYTSENLKFVLKLRSDVVPNMGQILPYLKKTNWKGRGKRSGVIQLHL